MPRSKVRGGRKQHNQRIQQRKVQAKADIIAIKALQKKIYEEAVERYKQTSGETIQQLWKTT
jgi:RNase P/RNase MRP subunit p30